MKLSVVIVNYNVRYYVEQCINSVLKASKGIDTEVFVVDNHSQDGSVEHLQKVFGDRIILIDDLNVKQADVSRTALFCPQSGLCV